MDNKENVLISKDVFCTSCGTKNSSKDNFCLNCGHELKKDINTDKINNNQSSISFKEKNQENNQKRLFGSGVLSKGIGILTVTYFSLQFGVGSGNYFILLIPIFLVIFYFTFPTGRLAINTLLDVIGKLTLLMVIGMLLFLGACFLIFDLY